MQRPDVYINPTRIPPNDNSIFLLESHSSRAFASSLLRLFPFRLQTPACLLTKPSKRTVVCLALVKRKALSRTLSILSSQSLLSCLCTSVFSTFPVSLLGSQSFFFVNDISTRRLYHEMQTTVRYFLSLGKIMGNWALEPVAENVTVLLNTSGIFIF